MLLLLGICLGVEGMSGSKCSKCMSTFGDNSARKWLYECVLSPANSSGSTVLADFVLFYFNYSCFGGCVMVFHCGLVCIWGYLAFFVSVCHWGIVVCVCVCVKLLLRSHFFYWVVSLSLFFFACFSLRNSLHDLVRTFGDVFRMSST